MMNEQYLNAEAAAGPLSAVNHVGRGDISRDSVVSNRHWNTLGITDGLSGTIEAPSNKHIGEFESTAVPVKSGESVNQNDKKVSATTRNDTGNGGEGENTNVSNGLRRSKRTITKPSRYANLAMKEEDESIPANYKQAMTSKHAKQ